MGSHQKKAYVGCRYPVANNVQGETGQPTSLMATGGILAWRNAVSAFYKSQGYIIPRFETFGSKQAKKLMYFVL